MPLTGNEFLYQRFGDVDFPVEGSGVEDTQLFSVFDPGRDAMIGLFKAAINQELGHSTSTVETTSPWYVARAGTPLATSMPVADTLYEPPRRSILRASKFTFPLLCLYRQSHEHSERTLGRDQIVATWGLDYILGPLNPADYRRLGGSIHAVRTLINLVIRRGFHPAYQDGAKQFGAGNGLFGEVSISEDQEGPANFGQQDEGVEFHALHMTIKTAELEGLHGDGVPPEATDFDGSDYRIGVGGENDILPDMIEIKTDVTNQGHGDT